MKPGSFVAILLLAVVALAHVLRLALGIEAMVGGVAVPMWVSAVGVGIPTFIAGLLWREARGTMGPNPPDPGATPAHLRRDGLDDTAIMVPHSERLLFAVTHVPGSTLACAARGDAAMFAMLQAYYALGAEAAARAGGRFVKGMGDGVLLTFPADRAGEAVPSVRAFQERATALWQGFDERCRVEVKVGAGVVYCGPLGPSGAVRFDVVGDALNVLFKAPWSGFHISPHAAALLQGSGDAGGLA